jgi:hypothetical protein
MSMREKLAWAREHGVAPPDYVLLAVSEQAAAEGSSGICCEHTHHTVASGCTAHDGGNCGAAAKPASHNHCRVEKEAAAPTVDWVIAVHAQKCQGLALLWITTGAIAPPPALVELPTDANPPAWYEPAPPEFWQGLSPAPDVPPPRIA